MPSNPTLKYGAKAARALDMWVKLARAFTVFNNRSNENIRMFGLTGAQFGALECLGHRGPMTIGELAKKMLVSGGNTTCIVDNLAKDGLVERKHGVEDRRVITVQLTKKGKALFDEIFPKHAECITKISTALTSDEQVQLGILLKKLGLGIREPL
jgi:MarR family 2-MHQ and catechol resistance regulon transcriptional repressor